MRDWLHLGEVLHRRLRPVDNAFRYPVFFLRFPLSRERELEGPLFGVNRFALFSFHHADHGDGRAPAAWIHELLEREGVSGADGEIELQTFPRVLGYVFNPVSFWYCHARDGALRAVVAEVNNTFGERHCYLLAHVDGRAIRAGETLTARKAFHVSPFCDISGGYRFRFHAAERGDRRRVVARIDLTDAEGDLIRTAISGEARAFGTAALLRVAVGYPLMTALVMARIHWQALRLWVRGVPFFRKPAPPAHLVSRTP